MNCGEIEEDGGLLEVDVLLGCLFAGLEGVMPREGDRINVLWIGGDGEAGLHDAKGAVVSLEEVAAGLGGVGWTVEI